MHGYSPIGGVIVYKEEACQRRVMEEDEYLNSEAGVLYEDEAVEVVDTEESRPHEDGGLDILLFVYLSFTLLRHFPRAGGGYGGAGGRR